MFTYAIFEEYCDNRTTYGIEILCNGNKIRMVHDVFDERILAEKTVELLSSEQSEPIHFDSIIENILQDPEYMLGVNYNQKTQLFPPK